MAPVMPLNIVTYNLHGFAQGSSLLSQLCTTCDIVFVQEHWLPSFKFDSLYNVCDDMVCYATSAMEDVISNGVLHGRPFGGVATFVKKSVCCGVKLISKHSRFIIIQIDNTVLINVYLPCSGSDNWDDEYVDCLAMIGNKLSEIQYTNIIFGGDLNVDFSSSHPLRSCLHDFFEGLNLRLTYNLLPVDSVTFRVEASGASSLIDHFAVSQHVYADISSIEVIDSGANLSDHCALSMSVKLNIVHINSAGKYSPQGTGSKSTGFRWDKADISAYYYLTGEMLYGIDVPHELLANDYSVDDETLILPVLDNFYRSIVSALFNASCLTVPRVQHTFYKFWWDEELSLLKNNSIRAHKLWTSLGKPRSGDIFRAMLQAKYEYKTAIRNKEKQSKLEFTDELNDALMNKDMNSFWRTWQSKFSRKKVSPVIDGLFEPALIAEKFADIFKAACAPNSAERHASLKDQFDRDFKVYNNTSPDLTVNVELVDRCVSKLKGGKASGHDGLTPEHLWHAHPIIISLLTYLFKIVVRFGVVPTDFGCGVVIPLVKNTDGDVTSSDNYRGITLSPVISKVFELMLMEMVSDKLTSSPLQFGFKAKSSCNHAIFTLRMLLKHFCSSGSTLTLCALDISKAFDRVNLYGLLNTLMARRFPRIFISIMSNWLQKCVGTVHWANCFSAVFSVTAGVRQGGLLSPALFAIYMDGLISRLKGSNLGCCLNGVYFGCLVYADDIMLLSHSVQTMQSMLDICESFAVEYDVKFNCVKSVAFRVGPRYDCVCADLILCNKPLAYVSSVKYLGVNITSGNIFKCSYDHLKLKFYRAFNALFCRSRSARSELVSVELVKAYCLPLLLYAVESTAPSRQTIRMMDRCIDVAVRKIFGLSCSDDCSFIRSCVGLNPMSELIKLRTAKFLATVTNNCYLFQLGLNELVEFLC